MTDPLPVPDPQPKTKPKKTKQKKQKTTETNLVSPLNPLAPFAEELLSQRVGPILRDTIEDQERQGTPIQSRVELLALYNQMFGTKLSMTVFARWCRYLKLNTRTTFSFEGIQSSAPPSYVANLPMPADLVAVDLTKDTPSDGGFDNQKVLSKVTDLSISSDIVIPRDAEGSGILELQQMMAGAKS